MAAFVAAASAYAGPLQDEVAQDRQDMRRLLSIALQQIELAPGLIPGMQAQMGGAVHVPEGFDPFITENRTAIQAALVALEDDKPMTAEALEAFRKAYAQMPADNLYMLPNILQNTAVTQYSVNVGAGMMTFGLIERRYDEAWRMQLQYDTRTIAPDEGRYVLDQIAQARVPALEPRFVIGAVTLESTAAMDRLSQAQIRRSTQAEEVARIRRQLTAERASYDAANGRFIREAVAEQDRLEVRLQAAGQNPAQIDQERRYARIALRNLAIIPDVLRETLEATEAQLRTEEALLASLEAEERALAEKLLPPLISITSDHAKIVAKQDVLPDLEELNKQIAAFEANMAELRALRDGQRENVTKAGEKADAASIELGDARFNSVMLQASVTAAIQLADLAVSSKGNPYVFVALAGTQMAFNTHLSPPSYYEARLTKSGEISTSGASSVDQFFNGSAGASFSKSVAEPVANYLSPKFVPLAERAAIKTQWAAARNAHKSVLRSLKNVLRPASRVAARDTVVGAIVQGLIVDGATEVSKAVIAAELEEDELRAYAKAQLELAFEVNLLKSLTEVLARDGDWLQALYDYRDQLRAGFGDPLDGRAKFRPVLEYRSNRPFEAAEGYAITLKFVGAEPPALDVYLHGRKLTPTEAPETFVISPEVIEELALGAPVPLDLRAVLR